MALNAAVIMPPLQQILWDKTLDVPLAAGQVYFWEDSNRTIPKNVYQLTGTGPGSYTYTSLGAVLTLSGIGTFVDGTGNNIAVYLWPFTGSPNDNPPSQTVQNYYITVYSSTGVFQFDIPNWPGTEAQSAGINDADTTENILSNPEFSQVNFSPIAISIGTAVTFSTAGTNVETVIAPDWSVITTGTGTFSVYQQQVSDSSAPGNPAYALGISSSGYSQAIQLRQRLTSPRLFAAQYVSGTFIAEATSGGPYTLTMNYTPSITGTVQQICTGTTVPGGFTTIANNPPVLITNPGVGTGYVDITILIPVGASIQISCIQLCGVSNSLEIVSYLQQSPQREYDHLFNYFGPQLAYKPIPSHLVGWDFPLNPTQWGGSVGPFTIGSNNKAFYAWDQTIVFQSTDGSITVTPSSSNYLHLAVGGSATQLAIVQYLDGHDAKALFIDGAVNNLSSNILVGSSSACNMTVSLWWSTSAPPAMTFTNPTKTTGSCIVTTLDANGHPNAVAAGWSEIPNIFGRATFSVSNSGALVNQGFTGFQTNSTIFNTGNYFAIVVGTSSLPAGTNINFKSVSLVSGMIATIPGAQTASEVLRECQYYYETTYPLGVTPGTIGNNTLVSWQQCTYDAGGAGSNVNYVSGFGRQFKVPKRNNMTAAGQLLIFSPLDTVNLAGNVLLSNLSGTTSNQAIAGTFDKSVTITSNGYVYQGNGNKLSTGIPPYYVSWHDIADARLGVYN